MSMVGKNKSFLDGSSDEAEEDNTDFRINKDYAAKYDNWRQKEEFEKLKARYGEDAAKSMEASDSSSSDTEDENLESNPAFEKDFFKTLSCLISDDPKIYDKNRVFFPKTDENGTQENKKKIKKEKPIYLKDYERKIVLEKGGQYTDEEDSENEGKKAKSSLTYVQEQKEIIESFKTALDDSDEDNLLQERQKTKEEKEKEEEDYLAWLKGRKVELNDEAEKEMKYLRDYWNDPKLDSNEAFLRDYVLNKRYLEQEDKNRIPAYNEFAHDSEDLSEDEKTLQKQAEFEHKFNFRFEEPDAEFIKHYPRTMRDSYRKKNTQRKEKREERKLRKLQEKESKKEELKRLKALKRKEILEKLEKLKQITGNTVVGFDDDDIEGEFDPEAHDKKMQKIFDNDYYEVEEDAEKPEFNDDDEDYEMEDWDNWTRSNVDNGEYGDRDDYPHCEDPDFNMDADYNPEKEFQGEMINASRNKKRKRKSKFAEVMNKAKPLFNADDETFDCYLDEYYKLDYEDLIGDLPCRFKYRRVVPNDFGLSVDEILSAEDKELNKWCSLKKAYQYRTKEQEQYDVHAYSVKAKNLQKKKKVLASLYEEPEQEEISQKKRKKLKLEPEVTTEVIEKEETLASENTKKKKSKKKLIAITPEESTVVSSKNIQEEEGTNTVLKKHKKSLTVDAISNKDKKKRKNRKQHQRTANSDKKEISDERLRAYGLNPKKFKHKKKMSAF